MPARKQRTTEEVRARLEGDACAGCLKPFKGLGRLRGAGVDLFPGAPRAYVCWGRGQRASERCTHMARLREAACPGCGDKPCTLGTICEKCTKALARGKSVEARKLEWWGVAAEALGPYLNEYNSETRDWEKPMETLAQLLCKAVATGRVVHRNDPEAPRGAGWNDQQREVVAIVPSKCKSVDYGRSQIFYVELVKGQGEALEAVLEQIRETMRAQWKSGFEKGNSILRRLADGEKGILESERDLEQAREHHERDGERAKAWPADED